MKQQSAHARLVCVGLYLASALIAACGGGSSNQFVSTPTALIATINTQPTSGAGTKSVAITVRSGADVQLSGEDSYGGNISITAFSWAQTGGPSVGALLYRNASTISFTAPSVSAATTLSFQLGVTNASGLTGTANSMFARAEWHLDLNGKAAQPDGFPGHHGVVQSEFDIGLKICAPYFRNHAANCQDLPAVGLVQA